MTELWPIQVAGIEGVRLALAAGRRAVCMTSPTGTGKTRDMAVLVRGWLDEGLSVLLYTHRRLLLDQLSDAFNEFGLYHGIRSARHDHDDAFAFQIASVQTEHSRVTKKKYREVHKAHRVLFDEAHLMRGKTIMTLRSQHLDDGAAIIGITATPCDLADLYESLVVAGHVSDGFKCGALVPCLTYGPDEPDVSKIKKMPVGELSEEWSAKLFPRTAKLFGRIFEWFNRLNPEHKPTLCFGPSVAGSLWIAEQFTKNGVRACHIDGSDVWLDGELHRGDDEVRANAIAENRAGKLPVLCNRYVLREGIDLPWIRHGIIATIFGSIESYVQSVGRFMRNDRYPDTIELFGLKTHCTTQDHGGNWWRHGSPNEDRHWFLDVTATQMNAMRADRIREGRQAMPRSCPECGKCVVAAMCTCGFKFPNFKCSRPVLTAEGELKLMHTEVFKARAILSVKCTTCDGLGCAECELKGRVIDPNGPKKWATMYWRSRGAKKPRSFRQSMALFAQENYWQFPHDKWPLMPVREVDFYRKVCDVPYADLIQPPEEFFGRPV